MSRTAGGHIDTAANPIDSDDFRAKCRHRLDQTGALVLPNFFPRSTVGAVVQEFAAKEAGAFYAGSTHNVYLTTDDPTLAADHPRNRQIRSSKGLIADDEVPAASPLREIYNEPRFRAFLCDVLTIPTIHPYDDDLSSVNVHFAAAGMELGWHFDNSSFAVTMLLQAPEAGGVFEYVPAVRDSKAQDQAYDRVKAVLDGETPVLTLDFDPGSLVLFRGRDALHRVTPTVGDVTRMLVVFAFNDEPGVRLTDSALETFYGRRGSAKT